MKNPRIVLFVRYILVSLYPILFAALASTVFSQIIGLSGLHSSICIAFTVSKYILALAALLLSAR